ncbi:MAG: ADP-ribosylglycohydrolase family protein [Kiritimatiellae bacterium]|nr:ADP-ribosylglycohydrolase family protein [Kiritimatiellia bacterium]MBQ6329826.1 ADP-ribosylglycohydrolase family protein [Kiritimatiellia bacterium]
MIGAIVGDIAGSRFEWHNRKSKRFTFLKGENESRHPCRFTDDSVMTLAVADAIMKWREAGGGSYDALFAEAVTSMQEFGRRYPHAGYGGHFHYWIHDDNPQPYNSWGNGSAMRVSACGWAGRTLEEVRAMSRAVTEVTHNHPEGIKGAEATAVATFLARTGKSMDEIKEVVLRDYYPLDFTLDEIRPSYEFDVSCQGSVPQALEAFFESSSFEDAIRNAISIGGDSDTIGAICGAVAGAYYGVPDDIRAKAETFLDDHLLKTLHDFERVFVDSVADMSGCPTGSM